MGIPVYVFGIPLILGLLGIGLYIMNQPQPLGNRRSLEYSKSRSYKRRKSFCDESILCSICREDMCGEDSTPLNCGHMFHDICLVEMSKRNIKTCPQCRADIIYK